MTSLNIPTPLRITSHLQLVGDLQLAGDIELLQEPADLSVLWIVAGTVGMLLLVLVIRLLDTLVNESDEDETGADVDLPAEFQHFQPPRPRPRPQPYREVQPAPPRVTAPPLHSPKPQSVHQHPDPDLKKIPLVRFTPGDVNKEEPKGPLRNTLLLKPPPSALHPEPGSMVNIVEQVEEILQENIAGTPLANRDIHVLENRASGGIKVQVGNRYFLGVDTVPDPEIKTAIKAAIAQWEKR